jgi:hypothetical protein
MQPRVVRRPKYVTRSLPFATLKSAVSEPSADVAKLSHVRHGY